MPIISVLCVHGLNFRGPNFQIAREASLLLRNPQNFPKFGLPQLREGKRGRTPSAHEREVPMSPVPLWTCMCNSPRW